LLAAHPEIFLQAKSSTTKAATSTWIMWALIAVMLVVFYFILIRPQRKRAQGHDQMVSTLKKGDEVVTIGGVHGTITRMNEETVVLEVDQGVKVTFSRSAIARSLTAPEEEEEEEEEEPELEDETEEVEEEAAEEEPEEEEPEEPTGKKKK
jgi:preprotein translocase subunit YajC